MHPGQSAHVYVNNQPIGWLGKLHPKFQQQYGLTKTAMLFELEINALLATHVPKYQEVSKFLPVRRDLAVVVNDDVSVQAMLNAVNQAQIPLVQQIKLFDVYQGKGIPENQKSLALSILMHNTMATLTDSDIDASMLNLIQLLQNKFGAVLRN